MAGKGGRTSGTWLPGQNPVKKKGQIHKKTKIAQAIGVKGWSDLKGWVEGPGIEKYVQEVQKLKGLQFAQELRNIAEFVRPKLARTEVAGQLETIVYNVDASPEKIDQIKKAFDNDY